MKKHTITLLAVTMFIATICKAQSLLPITSNMVTTSGNMPVDPIQFFDGNVNTPTSSTSLISNFTDTAQFTGWCLPWSTKCGTCQQNFRWSYCHYCEKPNSKQFSFSNTYAKNVGSLKKGSTLVVDLSDPKYITKINFMNILNFISNNSFQYSFNGNITIAISTSLSTSGSWTEVGRMTINPDSIIGNSGKNDSIIINKASRFWKIQLVDFVSSFTISHDTTLFVPHVGQIEFATLDTSRIGCTSWVSYDSSKVQKTSKKTINADSIGLNIGEIQFYSQNTNFNMTICQDQLPFYWDGLIFNSAGVQTAHFKNAAGSDSSITLGLAVNPTSKSITNVRVNQGCSYTFNGNTYPTSGVYTTHLTNTLGCDSTATLVLSVDSNLVVPGFISTKPFNAPFITTACNVTASSSYGVGIVSGVGYSKNFGGSIRFGTWVQGWLDNGVNATFNTAQTKNQWVQFVVAPSQDYRIKINGFKILGRNLSYGKNCKYAICYAIDDTTSFITGKCNFINLDGINGNTPTTINDYLTNPSDTLGQSILVNSGSKLYVRIYMWMSTQAIGTGLGLQSLFYITDFKLFGSVTSICPSTNSTINANICAGNNYIFNGNTFSKGGSYVLHLNNSVGCDSIAILNLNINTPSFSITNANICSGTFYTFNGSNYTKAGIYTAHLTNASGCDSAATLNLTVKATSTSTTNASICADGSYTFNGTAYTKPGTYVAHLTNAAGCDSAATLTLTIKSLSTSTTNAAICAGVSYTFNGATYTKAGTYVAHLTNAEGCDSAATLNLTIKALSTSTTNAAICAGGSYTFNGTSYTKAGTYVARLTNAVGCDSSATLNLTVKATSTSTTNVSICAGVSYTFNGTTYTTAGTYVAHLINAAGCDSAATLNLTVKATSTSTTNASICSGGSYTFNGTSYTKAGTYVAHLTNAAGCDSAATLALTIKSLSTSTTNASICAGGSYTFNGTSYTKAGTYVAHLTNTVGCDSAATLNLTIKSLSTSTTNASICTGGSYTFNGTSYTKPGTYVAHLTNVAGCDSAVTLNLAVKQNSKDTIVVTTATPYTWHGNTYTKSGVYTFDTLNSVGCDSLTTLLLTSTLPISFKDFVLTSNSNRILLNWHISSELNTFIFIIQHSIDGSSFTDIGTVKAIGSGANGYQFTDNSPTNGTNYYRLKCVDKDGSISYSKTISVQLSIINSQLSIFPNPTEDKTTISFGKLIDKATIVVYDITGKAIITQQINNTNSYLLNTQKLTKGIYIVKVKTGAGSTNGKLVIER